MRRRLADQGGFGLIELLISMTVLNIGILALVAAFSSGVFALNRASQTSTASTLASSQIELYRAVRHIDIRLDTGLVAVANTDTLYASDSAHPSTQITAVCPLAPECNPSRSTTGADGRAYRIDTYICWATSAADPTCRAPTGDPAQDRLKRVTVVVRSNAGTAFARQVSTFDRSTG